MTTGIIIGLVLYGLFVFGISIRASKKTQGDSEQYLVAGRAVGPVALLGTTCLSIWSALAFYGYGAGLYRAGIGYFGGAVGAFFVGIYAPTIMYRLWLLGKRYNYLTPGDFFCHRYRSRFYRLVVSFVSVICIIPYISVQITGVANGITTTSSGKIGFWLVAAILSVYIFLHVLKGGNKSVVGTDTLAGFTGISIAVITSIVFISRISGGLGNATKTILQNSPQVLEMSGVYSNFIGFFGLAMSAGMSIIAWPHIAVRSYMAKSEDVFKVMGTAFPLLELLAFGMFAIQGIWAGRAAYPNLTGAATDTIIPMMALEYAPAVLGVFLVMGVFAFGMSTADSQLVVASSIINNDVIPALGKNKKESRQGGLKNTQIWLFILMALVLVVVKFRPPFLVTYAYGFCAPGFAQLMPALFGGIYWRRSTTLGAITGTIGGCLAVIITLFIYNPIPNVHGILWGLLVNVILFVTVSLCTRPDQRAITEIHDELDAFFRSRNTPAHKVLLALVAVIFVQAIVVSPYLPSVILFGWCPLPAFNYILCAFELAAAGYFLAKNRLYEPDGSKKEFGGIAAGITSIKEQ
ncbi:MAG: sodium:solute symporter family protein [Treponema sp.]|nr:sodium:solute symporter family protein [Treponema sp.]